MERRVFLGNGDGTFKQLPLTIPNGTTVVAIADLNGDGILDVVSGTNGPPSGGSTIYAGNGDGTFQATGFYTVPLAPYAYEYSIAIGDVNGDGNPDLLVSVQGGVPVPSLAVYLGDGHGNFTQDTNTYFVGASQSNFPSMTPTRLNNQAPALPHDSSLDVLGLVTGDINAPYVHFVVEPDQSSSRQACDPHQHNGAREFVGNGYSWRRDYVDCIGLRDQSDGFCLLCCEW